MRAATRSEEAVIIDAVRSPCGTKGSPLVGIRSDDLAAQVLKRLIERNPGLPPEQIEDVSFGCVFPEATQGMLVTRGACALAGLSVQVSANVVSRNCGSAMDAVHQVSRAIETGDFAAAIGGGVEDMFGIPMGGFNISPHPELAKKQYYISMGDTAENLARELGISRAEQEEFAVQSHQKALAAWKADKFASEIVPIEFGGQTIARDSGPREPNLEKMRSLAPAFDPKGTVTPATSSPFTVASAAVLLTSRTLAEQLGLRPRARIVSRGLAGVDWCVMGTGPLPATAKALEKAGLTIDDIDVIELNEAFAAQALYCIRKGGWPKEKINFNGGALALGHALGASGARLLATLVNVLEQRQGRYGLATMCVGGGMGISTIIERL